MRVLTIKIPDAIYQQIEEQAKRNQRTVEEESAHLVSLAVPVASELSVDLTDAISPLALLDDAALWRAARNTLSKRTFAKLEALHLKRQREGLNENETASLADLMRQYDQAVLVRAHAINLLKQRGHDISSLLTRK